jgi:glycosyltransferase involved in cell wall biosynthesis
MPNKTVLHLTGMHSTKYGGVEHYLLELARYCNSQGYQTTLQYESMPHSQTYLNALVDCQVKVIVSPTQARPLQTFGNILSLIKAVRPETVQVHFVNRYGLFFIPVVARLMGVKKTLIMVHSMPHARPGSPRRHAYNLYDHVIGVSQAVSDNVIYGGARSDLVSTHYLGLFGRRERSSPSRTALREKFGISEQATVIACIAFDTPFKGLDVLLESFARLRQCGHNIHLIIIGVEAEKSALPQLAVDLGIADFVHWPGISDDGWQILNAADIYTQPSRHSEAIGLAVMEAMALKLPVVGTNLSGIPEAVVNGQTGYLAEPGDVDSLTSAFERLLSEVSNWPRMGEAGYQRYLTMFRGERSVQSLFEKYYRLPG